MDAAYNPARRIASNTGDAAGPMVVVSTVGIPFIDAQHAQLLAVLDRLQTLAGTSHQFAAIVEALDALFSYAQTHLAQEEALLKRAGYPRYEAHVAMHRQFIDAIMDLMARLEAGEEIFQDLVLAVRSWLVEHINVADMDYAAFLPDTAQKARP